MLLKISAHSECGKKEKNQDAFAIWLQGSLFCSNTTLKSKTDTAIFSLADGISSSAHSDIVAQNACSWICENYNSPETYEAFDNFADKLNEHVVDFYKEKFSYPYYGGTTVSAVAFSDNCIDIFNVGDSPIYILRDDLIKLSREHTLAQRKKDTGKVPSQSDENALTAYLGNPDISGSKQIHYDLVDVINKDKVLICSDGLSKFVDQKKIKKVLSNKFIKNKAKTLVNMAKKSSTDNITAIVVEFLD